MLDRFVAEHSLRPWRLGETDCCLVLADWVVFAGFADSASHLRGAYSDEAGYQAIVARHGGLVPLVGACAAAIGLEPVTEPEFGAIAVIGAPLNKARQFGAICDGHRWLVRVDGQTPAMAFVPFAARALAIWRVPCPRS